MPSQYPNRVSHPSLSDAEYHTLYEQSIRDPETFWVTMATRFVTFQSPWTHVKNGAFAEGTSTWFEGATLNVCYNCVDRHLPALADKPAFIWESDDPNVNTIITYQALYHHVCRFANLLSSLGLTKGDRVCLYLPMIPEATFAMLACARLGLVHSVVFAGFSPTALRDRINDADCRVVITADESVRGGKHTPLKNNVDKALESCPQVQHVVVVKRTHAKTLWNDARDIDYHNVIHTFSDHCNYTLMQAEDPLFILYTSGSTGKPKGILHTTAGYLVYVTTTLHYVFNVQPNDIYWCTADIGWITGHSYIVYGPLANGITSILFEGIPTYPSFSRFWQIVDKHRVTIFYTAPTALRALMREGDTHVTQCRRDSLRLLGSVGEPINPEAWEWYYHVVGNGRCPIMDTWWQTETGGFMITPIAGIHALKSGSATRPFFGIEPVLLDANGNELPGEAEGSLAIKQSWPGMLRSIYGDAQRFLETYLHPFKGYYFTGDGARRDKDGDYWITGRVDDIIVVSGHNLGTAEIESALVEHAHVAEAAVVGIPDALKGNSIYAFVTLKADTTPSDALKTELNCLVRDIIGPIAKIDAFQWANQLPKTRSGKIMRRLLRKIAENKTEDLGDTSTLADPSVVDALVRDRRA